MNVGRTASVLLTDQEERAIKNGLRLLYRPLTLHWDGQFAKFKEPKQATLVGFEVQDIVHLMKDTGKVKTDDRGKERPLIVKVESRVIKRINDEAIYPEDYGIDYDNLEPMDECWIIALGERVG